MVELIGFDLAIIVVTISILLSGIAIGIGRAAGNKKIEGFGIEELIQSIINSAIVGGAVVIIETIKTIGVSTLEQRCADGNLISELMCSLTTTSGNLFSLFRELVAVLNTVGYYQALTLDLNVLVLQPFVNLESISSVISGQAYIINLLIIVASLNMQIVEFIANSALALIFPIGLVFRAFFATRKVGGFLISIAVAIYIIYPAFILIFPTPSESIENARLGAAEFNSNPLYATQPIIDLNDNYALAEKLDLMSMRINSTNATVGPPADGNSTADNESIGDGGTGQVTTPPRETQYSNDFVGDLTIVVQKDSNAISASLFYVLIAPLFSLLVTVVFIRELADILGGELVSFVKVV